MNPTRPEFPGTPPVTITRCRVCRRTLKDPTSVLLGIGPTCRRTIRNVMLDVTLPDRYDLVYDPTTRDMVCKLEPDLTNRFNIWQAHRHHSPHGMAWGYVGNAPRDYALNILAMFEDQFPPKYVFTEQNRVIPHIAERISLWDGTSVHPLVWDAHRTFAREVVAIMPDEGTTLHGDFITSWITSWLAGKR